MLEATEGRFRVDAAIPGIAGTGDEGVVDPNERSILVTRRVAWSKYPELMVRSPYRTCAKDTPNTVPPTRQRSISSTGTQENGQ